MPLRAVFLDVGNTLLTEKSSRPAIYAAAGRERGLDVGENTMLELMRRAHAELPERVEGGYRYSDPWFAAFIEKIFVHHLGLDEAALPMLREELFARFEDAATFRVLPGAEALLDRLRGHGLVVGAVSNWSSRLPRLLTALDLARRFDFVLSSADLGCEKPDPRIFRAALERAAVPAADALHAGDSLYKDGGARAVGIGMVLVDPLRRAGETPPDVPIARDLDQLGRIIEERLS